jgi:CRP/FNR family cyclic AMP-dependent transcriptional regulator
MDVVSRTLSEFGLFAQLDGAALREIALHVAEAKYDPDQIIALSGEPCTGVSLVVQGEVSMQRLSVEGREYVLDYLGPGDTFNLVPVLDGGPALATVQALSYTTLYVIPAPRFLDILDRHKPVSRVVLELLATQVRYLSDAVEDLALHTVRTRLARFLLSNARSGSGPVRHWTQEEIAAHIGTVRDVVGRTLRAFSREGLIRRERGRLVVADVRKMEQEAMLEQV